MFRRFKAHYPLEIPGASVLVNIETRECSCLDYVWRGPTHKCKHVHAADLQRQVEVKALELTTIKSDLVNFFRNRERVIDPVLKNMALYCGTDDDIWKEILRLYESDGSAIFAPRDVQNKPSKDPFRPEQMPRQENDQGGAPRTIGAKPRKPSRFPTRLERAQERARVEQGRHSLGSHGNLPQSLQSSQHSIPPSVQKRTTQNIRKRKRRSDDQENEPPISSNTSQVSSIRFQAPLTARDAIERQWH
jgi:hypothetical protein